MSNRFCLRKRISDPRLNEDSPQRGRSRVAGEEHELVLVEQHRGTDEHIHRHRSCFWLVSQELSDTIGGMIQCFSPPPVYPVLTPQVSSVAGREWADIVPVAPREARCQRAPFHCIGSFITHI
jgi:hypothetical protein